MCRSQGWVFRLALLSCSIVVGICSNGLGAAHINLSLLPVGTEFPTGTEVHNYEFSGGTSRVVLTDIFSPPTVQKAIELNGTVSGLGPAVRGHECCAFVSVARAPGTEALYSGDSIEINGEHLSLSDLINGPSEGPFNNPAFNDYTGFYRVRPLSNSYEIGFGFFGPMISFSVHSGGAGLHIGSIGTSFFPEPSTLGLLLAAMVGVVVASPQRLNRRSN